MKAGRAKELVVASSGQRAIGLAIGHAQDHLRPAHLHRRQTLQTRDRFELLPIFCVRVSRSTVSVWRTRYRERGIAGLHNELELGRPRSTGEGQIAKLINTALKSRPKSKTHWSRRSLAEATGLSTTTVHRYLTMFGVQPHRSRSFELSTDPFFIEKVREVVGL